MSAGGLLIALAILVAAPLLAVVILGRVPGVAAHWQNPVLHGLLAAVFLSCALLSVLENEDLSWSELLVCVVTSAGALIFASMAGLGASKALRWPTEASGKRR